METGILIKSTNFHTEPYWVVKCDRPNLTGNRNQELPIDQPSMKSEWNEFMGKWYSLPLMNRKVKFELVEIGDVENCKWHARLK